LVEKPRRIELENDLRSCGAMPTPPDPDDPATTQKAVGDYLYAYYAYSARCGNRHGTTVEIIDRNNQDADAASKESK